MNTENNPSLEGIAIIGLAGRFPGADDISKFWNNLTEGRETISTLALEDIPPEERTDDPDYIPRRGLLDKAEWFDAAFFNISPREAEVIEPQQRVFLEACWHALENAGCDPQRFTGSIGVYAGMSNNSWLQQEILPNVELRDQIGYETAMIANEKDYLATRVAFKLNLRGPALNVYTACSTSLVAVCQAVAALQSYQCDAALAGGVSVKWPQARGYVFQEGSILAPDGHCRSYDADARGTVFSNGLGVVVLKRLEDAVRDGDHVWAVIKGAALNNDGGDKVSFTAPSVDGHAEVIALAHALAGVEADTISYVEGHGTATPIGDPIEVAGLTKAFRQTTERRNFCGLGSLKSVCGHMDAASGVAGLIKTALALHHKQLPPTLHFRRPNPELKLETSPFYIVDKLMPWPKGDTPRRAGVSNFGVGGTNAHCVIEEAPDMPAETGMKPDQLLILSAKTATALEAMSENLAVWLEESPSQMAGAAATLQLGRTQLKFRRAVSAVDATDAVVQLRVKSPCVGAGSPRVVFLFPGQGSQHLRMGVATYERELVFKEAFDRCSELFRVQNGMNLAAIISTDAGILTETHCTQPALFAVEYALAQLLMSWGLKPDLMLGHSIGEYVAATLSGVMTLETACSLVAARGQLLWAQPRGSMLAVRLPEAEVRGLLPSNLDIAAVNSPVLTVVSGSVDAIACFALVLEAAGHTARKLHTSHAFHSRLMDAAAVEFKHSFAKIELGAPQIPYISNVTGRPISIGDAMSLEYYGRHIREAVRFADGIAAACEDGPCLFIECGPGSSLTPLVRQQPAAAAGVALSCWPDAKKEGEGEVLSLLQTVGRAWASGAKIDWTAFQGEQRSRRLPLPGYPFERQRYCPDTKLPEGTKRDGEGWLKLGAFKSAALATVSERGISAAPESPSPLEIVMDRKSLLTNELRKQLHAISGIDVSNVDPTTPFLDLGFDSLFLTQASLALKKHFALKITFRQLMEDLTSIDTLAAWLDDKLPADAFAPQLPRASKSGKAAVNSANGAGQVANDSIEARLARMEHALGLATQSTTAAVPVGPKSHGITVRDQKGSEGKKVAFGPFKPLVKTKDGSLTSVQQQHLKDLVSSYCTRYSKAKEFTALHRDVFADPRAVAGFNLMWKDMVFPAVTDRSEGAYLWDTDGHRWIDVVHGFGLGFFGHRPKFVVDALHAQLDKGLEIGPTSPLAGEVAHLIREFSGQDRVAFCNTGSEALMAAIRVSRTISGRDLIVMFAGGYHGIFDEVLARPLVMNGELRSIPVAPGVPESAQSNIIVLEYGHPESLEILRQHGERIACVLVEPVMSRRPDVVPIDFVRELREITRITGTALVFDEVVLGFRTGSGGAQSHFGIQADLVTYGKVIGGGMPLGVICGQRKYMDALDGGAWQYGDDSMPEVGVTFFAGTFIRHPLTLAAARAVLLKLKEEGPSLQKAVEDKTRDFVGRLNENLVDAGVPITATRFSSMWMLNADPALKYFTLLFYHLRLRGIHLWEGRPGFLSVAHSETDVQEILTAFAESVSALQLGGFLPSSEALPLSVPTTKAQQEMFIQSQLGLDAALACHESLAINFDRPLDVVRLEKALNVVVSRHDCLRATFSDDGGTMQVHPRGKWRLWIVAGDVDSVKSIDFLTPFDLVSGPLIRASLVGTTLVLTAHHIVCDGWSFGVVLQDLKCAYDGVAFAGPAASYADFAAANRVEPEALDYWKTQFVTLPGPLALPTDHARMAVRDLFADMIERDLSPEVVCSLRHFCKLQKVTPYHVTLAAFEVLIHRLSGQSDFVVGTPVAAQVGENLPDLVGHCVRFLPLCAHVKGQDTVSDVVGRVRSSVLDATDHQSASLGSILEVLPHVSASARRSFAPVTFSFESLPGPLVLGDSNGVISMNAKQRLSFEMSLYVFASDSEVRIACAYQKGLYEKTTIERWLGQYETVLRAMVDNPNECVTALPLMSETERAALLAPTLVHLEDSGDTIVSWFARTALQYADRVAVSGAGLSYTYAELDARSSQLAHHLQSLGVKPETLVGLCLERTPEMVVAVLGILKAGGAYLPIDLSYPSERLRYMLQDAGAQVLLTQRSLQTKVPADDAHVLYIDDPSLWIGPTIPPVCESVSENAAYVIYTSGSTGQPKGCIVTHHNVVRLMSQTQDWFQFNETDVWTMFHSIAFDFSVWELWGALLYGGRLVVVPFVVSRSPEDFHYLLKSEGVTVLNQTPSAFRQLMHADETLGGKLALRTIIFGGEALEMESLRPWFNRHGDVNPRLVNMYGITETTVHVTYRPLSMGDVNGGSVIGIPIPDLSIHILDPETRQPMPVGLTGEMYIGGAGLARGYLNREKLTAERFIVNPLNGLDRLYKTGDLARFIPASGLVTNGAGPFLDIEYQGRIDHQVKIRGFRIELGEIETVLNSHPSVRESAVLQLPDANGEQRLVAWLVHSGVKPLPSDLRSHLLLKVPDYMVPTAFVFVDVFPLTTNGKLDRAALPAPDSSVMGTETSRVYIAPATPTQVRLAALWEGALGRNHFSAHSDFFASGGTSLNALRVSQGIRKEFGVNLPLGTFFETPTLSDLASRIDEIVQGASESKGPVFCIQPEGDGTPVFLIHGGDGGALFYRGLLEKLGTSNPVWVIESPSLTDDSWLLAQRSIEDCAVEYLKLIRSVKPTGNLIIGGYSYGGVVAYEIARLLADNDEAPEKLIFFDTENPAEGPRYLSLGERIAVGWRHGGNNVVSRIKCLGERVGAGIKGRFRYDSLNGTAKTMLENGQVATDSSLRTIQIQVSHFRAIDNYIPGGYSGSVVLFRSDAISDKYDRTPDYNWTSYVGNLEVIKVDGDHLDLFSEPYVGQIADKFRKVIESSLMLV